MRLHSVPPPAASLCALLATTVLALVSPAAALADASWSEVTPQPVMGRRAGHVAILDPVRDRVVFFGGYDEYDEFLDDTWTLSTSGTPTWEEIATAGPAPAGRYFAAGIYDPIRQRMIVFGGYDGSNRNDVWALSLDGATTWTQIAPAGTPPPPRWGHAAVYDPVRDRMLVMGGATPGGDANDVWALSLDGTPTWTPLAPSGAPPSKRRQHAAAYDPIGDRLIVLGGNDGVLRNDAWALDLSGAPAWSALSPSGAPPSGRRGHAAAYDPDSHEILVYGGYDGFYCADLFSLSLSGGGGWESIVPSGQGPGERYAAVAVLDGSRARLLVSCGDDGPNRHGDVWAVSLDEEHAWSDVTPPRWPSPRWGHATAYDSRRDRMLLVAGSASLAGGVADVGELTLGGVPAWALLSPQGAPPSGRRQHSAIYDPRRDRLIVFGGFDGELRNDTWALSLKPPNQWIRLTPSGSAPTPRRGHVAVYDAARDRMILFGGYDGAYLSDVWVLNLSGTPAWSKLASSGSPPAQRYASSAIVDPVRDRLVIFGGDNGSVRLNDAWALSLGLGPSWTRIETAAPRPGIRAGHTGIYDPARDRLVIFGGYNNYSTFMDDTWALSLGGTPGWTQLAPTGGPPPGRYFHSAVYDPSGDRMAIFGGYSDGMDAADLWFLDMGAPAMSAAVADEPAAAAIVEAAHRLELRVFGPNPVRGGDGAVLELAVPAPGAPASLRVFDTSGRCVATLHDGWMPGGASRRDLTASELRDLAAGVYFLRLEAGENSSTARIVLIR